MNNSSHQLSSLKPPEKQSFQYSNGFFQWHTWVNFDDSLQFLTVKRSKFPLCCCPDISSVSYNEIKSAKLVQEQKTFERWESAHSSYAPSRLIETWTGYVPGLIMQDKTNQNHFVMILADLQFHRLNSKIYKDQIFFLKRLNEQIQKKQLKAKNYQQILNRFVEEILAAVQSA